MSVMTIGEFACVFIGGAIVMLMLLMAFDRVK